MRYWVYKCNNRNRPRKVKVGDWNHVFSKCGPTEWGSSEWTRRLTELERGDRLLAYQTDRNELVGLAGVCGVKKQGQHHILVVEPMRELRVQVSGLKRKYATIARIPALSRGPKQTIYDITTRDAERLLRAAASEATPEYFVVNTNVQATGLNAHAYMLRQHRAAAFYDPWKYEIDRIWKNDIVFLYQSGVGIVAVGRAKGKVDVRPCGRGRNYEQDGEHSMKLLDFQHVDPPITANAMSAVSKYAWGKGVVLRPTVVHLRRPTGLRLHRLATVPNV